MKSRIIVSLFKLFALFPLPLLRRVGHIMGGLMWYKNTQGRKVTEDNIAACFPALSAAEQAQLARDSLNELAIMGLELGPAWRWSSDKLMQQVVAVEGLEHLAAAQQESGTLVLVPHLGNWEVLGVYLGLNYKTTSLYQPPEYPALDSMIYKARQRSGATLVPTNTSGVKSLLKALKRGELVAILPDQRPEPSGGEFAPFYGHPALTMTLVHNLVKRTGAKVVTGIAERVANGKFKIVFGPAVEAIYSKDLPESLAAMNQCVENCVKQCPAQYQWEYKRFKAQPDGGRWPYRR